MCVLHRGLGRLPALPGAPAAEAGKILCAQCTATGSVAWRESWAK
jgi:hypothetical protein